MSSIFDKSQNEKLELMIKQYKQLDEYTREYTLRMDLLKNEIINMYEDNNIVKHKGVKLVHRSIEPTLSIHELKHQFNGSILLDELIVKLDIKKSLEALLYVNNLQQPIVDAMRNKLENIKGFTQPQLVIEKE